MENIMIFAISFFAVTFLVSLLMFWLGKRDMNVMVMKTSKWFMIIAVALLILALAYDGTLFKDMPKEPKMFLK
jgi:heme/copper-type cytochrome/quinol oxidase subunit 1